MLLLHFLFLQNSRKLSSESFYFISNLKPSFSETFDIILVFFSLNGIQNRFFSNSTDETMMTVQHETCVSLIRYSENRRCRWQVVMDLFGSIDTKYEFNVTLLTRKDNLVVIPKAQRMSSTSYPRQRMSLTLHLRHNGWVWCHTQDTMNQFDVMLTKQPMNLLRLLQGLMLWQDHVYMHRGYI